jgi:hypothetical protein
MLRHPCRCRLRRTVSDQARDGSSTESDTSATTNIRFVPYRSDEVAPTRSTNAARGQTALAHIQHYA